MPLDVFSAHKLEETGQSIDPDRTAVLVVDMINEFQSLGPNQGAVLSYAPYISALLSDDPYENL